MGRSVTQIFPANIAKVADLNEYRRLARPGSARRFCKSVKGPVSILTQDSHSPVVLIVDDSSFLRKRVRQMLEGEGYTIVEAGNGEDALAELARRPVDCILSDLVMPVMDGFQLLAEIEKRSVPAPVIVVTADIQRSTKLQCKQLGAVAFIQKPVDAEVLRLAIAGAVQGRAIR